MKHLPPYTVRNVTHVKFILNSSTELRYYVRMDDGTSIEADSVPEAIRIANDELAITMQHPATAGLLVPI